MDVTAAVLPAVGEPVEIRTIDLAPPGPGELRVAIAASGVCHSDRSAQTGVIPVPTPTVLGHEGAGVVEEVGPQVTGFSPGDHVVLSFTPRCRRCFYCRRGQPHLCEVGMLRWKGGLADGTPRFSSKGEPVHQLSMCSTFAERTVVPAVSALVIEDDVPLHLAALLGCGVMTGVGAALNTARIAPGDRVAVIGCGGVGLNAVQGARIAGASRIIAVEPVAAKRELAASFGATDTVDPADGDAVEQVKAITGGHGADVVLEAAGRPDTVLASFDMASRGGHVVLVGVPAIDDRLPRVLDRIYRTGRSVTMSAYGSTDFDRDVPRLLDLWRSGRLLLEELVSQEIDLHDVQEAMADLDSATTAVRRVIRFDRQAG
jgi:Zn-dependent alcohol dehydrogenase